MNTNEQIAARLKQAREQRGLSQKALAEICGWAQSRVGNYESASRTIGIDDAVALAKALKMSPSELIFGEDSTQEWLTPQHRRLISLFDQLPESEQERMIDLFQVRLKEIDDYVEKYLRGRFKSTEE
ncbi:MULTISPECIES: helix-turn-helix domain-containing protein [Klebsiella]|uniref:helix-turn-helix domain-containing protein n=1 Tax=Klebsiella TaxID=570 RepID=UPI000515FF8B|nr:helix-turn-helix domain-containing protein [Klebsiella aerogenes]EKZ5807237.1 helix-turn-helix domain-containing protein [Klebsiella variicola]EKZ9690360.1 helix-turn-helix domain-containing protein [Klebsiella pneumoniae]EIV2479727.1 helix-turn-helix domain-containing protein [Klebsiella aerogenes]EIX9031719.1 helix-turn-helix domain-containing protein [Klebsiella aerogenes]EKU7808912.1 helix-turn-helix domain-containing protein [Klebsiella aerogenes]